MVVSLEGLTPGGATCTRLGGEGRAAYVPGPQHVGEGRPEPRRDQGVEHAGATSTERPKPFELIGDEPPVLLGTNAGPNAVELCLQALAFCYSVGFVYNAAARGIDISELRYEVEGDIDLHRFVGLGGPRAGFSAIRAKGWVRSPNATAAQLEDLCQYVQDTSPVRDILANPVPVSTDLVVLS